MLLKSRVARYRHVLAPEGTDGGEIHANTRLVQAKSSHDTREVKKVPVETIRKDLRKELLVMPFRFYR